MFRNRLQKVYRHIRRQAKRLNISCYRVYDHDLPEFPFCIEIYEGRLYVAEYKRRHGMTEEEHDEWLQKSLNVVSEILQTPEENIFLKLRQRKPGRSGQYQKIEQKQREFVVHENARPDAPRLNDSVGQAVGRDLKFIVNLSDYLDTGLFLDHRITREIVKTEANNKKVLNLFCYTGSFSVYAAAGGADEVVSVDLSKTYLNWAERNMELNGFADETKYKYVHADAKQYLKTIPKNYFDIVIMDTPTFSNSKRMEEFLDIQRDHVELINDCLLGMKTGGILYFSTNNRKFTIDKEKINSSSINDITKATTPFDFEGRLFRQCYSIMK
jgi:23S rRNA (cytosine1962-C5)-methyltransferase